MVTGSGEQGHGQKQEGGGTPRAGDCMKGKGERKRSEECMMLALVSYLINWGREVVLLRYGEKLFITGKRTSVFVLLPMTT